MTRAGFSIRPMRDADRGAFDSFASRHFGGYQPGDAAFTEHWFRRGDDRTVILLCRPDETLAGVMALIRVPARILDESTALHWISSILVEDDARKVGAGGRLLHWAHHSLPLVGSLCGNEASLPLTRALGRDVPGLAMRRFVFVHSRRCLEICDPDRVDAIARVPFDIGAVDERHDSRWREDFTSEAVDLWSRFLRQFAVSVARDRPYLEWRYLRAPHIRYRVLEVRQGERLVGVAVCRFQMTPSGMCNRIVDFAAEPDHASATWAATLRAAAGAGALYSDFIVIGTSQDSALLAAGFRLADHVLEGVPNLLAPVAHRTWSYSFHLGGALARGSDDWRMPEKVWFTKGDGDRDWPTPHGIENNLG